MMDDAALWKATVYQAGLGKLKVISLVSGIPMDVLTRYVETGDIDAANRVLLKMCAEG